MKPFDFVVAHFCSDRGHSAGKSKGYSREGQSGGYAREGQSGGYAREGQFRGYAREGQSGSYAREGQSGGYAMEGQSGAYAMEGQSGGFSKALAPEGLGRPVGRLDTSDVGRDRVFDRHSSADAATAGTAATGPGLQPAMAPLPNNFAATDVSPIALHTPFSGIGSSGGIGGSSSHIPHLYSGTGNCPQGLSLYGLGAWVGSPDSDSTGLVHPSLARSGAIEPTGLYFGEEDASPIAQQLKHRDKVHSLIGDIKEAVSAAAASAAASTAVPAYRRGFSPTGESVAAPAAVDSIGFAAAVDESDGKGATTDVTGFPGSSGLVDP